MGNSPQPVALEALNERGHGVRIEFSWDADRYTHKIIGVRGSKAFPLLQSVEGDGSCQSAPSPCLTELYQQEQTLFLTGATSESYWSLSVRTADVDLRDDFNGGPDLLAKMLRFEVACRVKREAYSLGSTYRVLDETRCGVMATEELAFFAGATAKPSFGIVLKSASQIACESEGTLRLTPRHVLTNSIPYTVQWNYEILWALR